MQTDGSSNRVSIGLLLKRTVRAFWEDGLWDLASVGIFLLLALWGGVYVQFVAFPASTWPFLENGGREVVWLGLLCIIVALAVYVYAAWHLVRKLKQILVFPRTGQAVHRFFLPVERGVFFWYFLVYVIGLAALYGFFWMTRGGLRVFSVPFIISPAAICLALGRIYGIRRYLWTGIFGLGLAAVSEFLLTTTANSQLGQANVLDVLPAWGSPVLPCAIWALSFAISGLVGLLRVRRHGYGGG